MSLSVRTGLSVPVQDVDRRPTFFKGRFGTIKKVSLVAVLAFSLLSAPHCAAQNPPFDRPFTLGPAAAHLRKIELAEARGAGFVESARLWEQAIPGLLQKTPAEARAAIQKFRSETDGELLPIGSSVPSNLKEFFQPIGPYSPDHVLIHKVEEIAKTIVRQMKFEQFEVDSGLPSPLVPDLNLLSEEAYKQNEAELFVLVHHHNPENTVSKELANVEAICKSEADKQIAAIHADPSKTPEHKGGEIKAIKRLAVASVRSYMDKFIPFFEDAMRQLMTPEQKAAFEKKKESETVAPVKYPIMSYTIKTYETLIPGFLSLTRAGKENAVKALDRAKYAVFMHAHGFPSPLSADDEIRKLLENEARMALLLSKELRFLSESFVPDAARAAPFGDGNVGPSSTQSSPEEMAASPLGEVNLGPAGGANRATAPSFWTFQARPLHDRPTVYYFSDDRSERSQLSQAAPDKMVDLLVGVAMDGVKLAISRSPLNVMWTSAKYAFKFGWSHLPEARKVEIEAWKQTMIEKARSLPPIEIEKVQRVSMMNLAQIDLVRNLQLRAKMETGNFHGHYHPPGQLGQSATGPLLPSDVADSLAAAHLAVLQARYGVEGAQLAQQIAAARARPLQDPPVGGGQGFGRFHNPVF